MRSEVRPMAALLAPGSRRLVASTLTRSKVNPIPLPGTLLRQAAQQQRLYSRIIGHPSPRSKQTSLSRIGSHDAAIGMLAKRYASSDRSHLTKGQVMQGFGRPLMQFVQIMSRSARVVVYIAAGIGTVMFGIWSSAHLYVEYVEMPKSKARVSDPNDPFGWDEETEFENWSAPGVSGTDSRLGFTGRLSVRAAWMNLYWGSGTTPQAIAQARARDGSLGEGQRTVVASDNGLELAEKQLAVAMEIAESKGIKLPDIAAVRSGFISAHEAGIDAPLDQTAVVLEERLAGLRERMGTPVSLPLAIAGYERIFDALTATQQTHDSVGHSGQPAVPVRRLMYLATKLGNLNTLLGRRDQAEGWLVKAVSLAGQAPLASHDESTTLDEISKAAEDHAEAPKGRFAHWTRKRVGAAAPPATASQSTGSTPPSKNDFEATPQPTPALTRSLISALLSISGFYATPPAGVTSASNSTWRSGLEKAVKVQASALRLLRQELERASLPTTIAPDANAAGGADAAELQTIWLRHNEGTTCLHLAETLYALDRSSSGLAGSLKHLLGDSSSATSLRSVSPHSKEGNDGSDDSAPLLWLLDALSSASQVRRSLSKRSALKRNTKPIPLDSDRALATPPEKFSARLADADSLQDKWKTTVGLGVPASRLLRDAGRVEAEATKMIEILQRKKEKGIK